MGILERLVGKKKGDEEKVWSFGDLTLRLSEDLERDPEARIEEYWIEDIDASWDGYWVLVGRRYGVFQLYDWKGRLHRLPARPPSQSVTDVVFEGRYLSILAPPYLVVYYLKDPKDPSSWESFRLSQEGVRPSGGLSIRKGTLLFGAVGERVCGVDLSGNFSGGTLEFRTSFTYRDSDIGDLKVIRILPSGRVVLGGVKGVALYSLNGKLLKRLDLASSRAVTSVGEKIYLADRNSKKIVVYDAGADTVQLEVPLHHIPSSLDVSPDGRFLLTADEEENRLGVYDLSSGEFLGFLEGYGYSVVRISPDGYVYTSRFEDSEEGRLYFLERFETNLLDLLYPQERKKRVVSNAKKVYKNLVKKLRSARSEEEAEGLEEFKELASIDIPFKEVRELYESAVEKIEERKFQIFLSGIEKKLKEGTVTGEDYEELVRRIEVSPDNRKGELSKLKEKLEEHFKKETGRRLSLVKESVERVRTTDLRDLEALEEVKEARKYVSKLPKEIAEEAAETLSKILQEKVVGERLKTFSIRDLGDRVLFGREEFPKFRGGPRRLRWRVRLEERIVQGGKVFGRIVFEREDGLLAEPRRFPSLLPEEELRPFPSWVPRYLKHLNGLLSKEKVRVPTLVSFEDTPWFVQNLERFTSLVKEQIEYQEGIVILEGDAGVGKNFLVEVFSALTGRPLFIVPCNSKMEKEDITFVYEFDPRRGTRKVYSDLVKALRTPGAVIYLDEINTLPPSLVKIFNPLFDYRRYLVLSQGEVVRAEKEVILVGGMNPQNYLGVSELPQDIKSRADVLYIDYPPFQDERGFYYPDEALILKDYTQHLSKLGKEEFTYLWYLVVNGVVTEKGEKVRTPEREEEIRLLFDLLRIANEIRKAYRAYQTQQSEEPVDFVFSIRDTIRCARRLRKYGDAKKAVEETVIPKISSPLEKEIVRSIIERA